MRRTMLLLSLGAGLAACGGPEKEPSLRQGAAASHLDYYGGHVMSQVKVVDVYWGSSVDPQVTAWAGPYFQAITQSPYFDMLQEYDTQVSSVSGQPGTNQVIYRGSWAGDLTITPTVASGNVGDAQIQTELDHQIGSGVLPPADLNTIYMSFFPPAVTVVDATTGQCINYCAYHNSFTRADGSTVVYAVIPDMASSCEQACGPGDVIGNNENSASHELMEAVTDPQVTFNSTGSLAYPYAWIEGSDGQEIGDLCLGQDGMVSGQLVQLMWSNVQNACIAQNPAYTPLPTPSATPTETPAGTPSPTPGTSPAPGHGGSGLVVGGGGCGCDLMTAEVPGTALPLGVFSLVVLLLVSRRI